MTRDEYEVFQDAMHDLNDPWTIDEIAESSFADMALEEAITRRSMELEEFNKSLTTAVNYMLND